VIEATCSSPEFAYLADCVPKSRLKQFGFRVKRELFTYKKEQKSSIRKMSSDFLEGVERVPQRSQFAAAYGFWK
jgi:hypothetical protein